MPIDQFGARGWLDGQTSLRQPPASAGLGGHG